MFLVVSQLDVHFSFEHQFLEKLKLRARKIGRLERNLSTPVNGKLHLLRSETKSRFFVCLMQ